MNAYSYEKCVKWKLGAVEMVGKDCLIAMGEPQDREPSAFCTEFIALRCQSSAGGQGRA